VLADLASVRYGDGIVLARVEKGGLYLLRDPKGDPITPSRLFEGLPNSIRLLEGAQASEPIGDLKHQLEPPVPSPSKVIGIGKNFREHAVEMKSEAKPVYFMKAPSALVGHLHVIDVPAFVQKPDYEGEVVIVIGRKVKLAGLRRPGSQYWASWPETTLLPGTSSTTCACPGASRRALTPSPRRGLT